VRTERQLLIGEPIAEHLKIRIGSARCVRMGVPREATIRSGEVHEALSAPLERIMSAIREALEHAPPELSADLIETGIVLTGGSALLRNSGPGAPTERTPAARMAAIRKRTLSSSLRVSIASAAVDRTIRERDTSACPWAARRSPDAMGLASGRS